MLYCMVIIGFMHAAVLGLDHSTFQNFQEGYAVNRAMTKLKVSYLAGQIPGQVDYSAPYGARLPPPAPQSVVHFLGS